MDLAEFRARSELSEITENLYIGPMPKGMTAEELIELGVGLVITMTFRSPGRATVRPPIEWVYAPAIDFPLTPIPLRSLRHGVAAALPVMARGKKVLVHCRWGRHRSVVMACAILIAQGCTAETAIELVERRRAAADARAFYVESRIKTFERVWRERWAHEVPLPEGLPQPPCVPEEAAG